MIRWRDSRSRSLGVALVGVAIVSACVHPARVRRTSCWLPSQYTDRQVEIVRSLVIGTDSASDTFRSRTSLPLVATSDVQAVTDEAVCARAVSAHAAVTPVASGLSFTKVMVIRVGPTRYVVFDGYTKAGEFDTYAVYDENFNRVGSFAG